MQVGSTGVRLIKPQGFAPARGFDGFQHEDSPASLMVQIQPGPVSGLLASLTSPASRFKGLEVLAREDVQAGLLPAILLEIRQRSGGTCWHKWALITGNDQESVLIMASWPEERDVELADRLRKAVLTARWEGEAQPGEPDFTLAPGHGDLKPAYTSRFALTYTRDGLFPCARADDPLLVASRSMPGAVPNRAGDDLQAFAEGLLERRHEYHYTSISETIPVELDGMPGFRSIASAIDIHTNAPVSLYQMVLIDQSTKEAESAYYLILGTVGTDGWDAVFKSFDALARSFRRRT